MKRNILLLLIAIAIIGSCRQSVKANASAESKRCAEHVTLADPFIMLYNDTYYAYGTYSDNGIAVFTSENLESWKKEPALALDKKDSYGEKWFWAPEVYYINGKFYMYYSAEEHICAAVSDFPIGPFVQLEQKPIIENEKCIDNTLFIDDNGKAYMFFCRFNDGLNVWVAEMNDDFLSIKHETMQPCIHTSQPWEQVWPRVNEGPFVIKHDGTYYMTYSANSFESQYYGIGCAVSSDIMGPWEKYEHNPLLQKPKKLLGTGHHCIFKDKQGNLRLAFHSHKDQGNIHPREMHITDVGFKTIKGEKILYIDDDYMTPVLKK